MIKGTRQAALEQAIHEAIDQGDERTLEAYGERAGGQMVDALCAELCVALLQEPRRGDWPGLMAVIMDRSPALALALLHVDDHIKRHRAGFMEAEAQRCMTDEDRMKEDAA